MITRHEPSYKFRANMHFGRALVHFAPQTTRRSALYFGMFASAHLHFYRFRSPRSFSHLGNNPSPAYLAKSSGFILVATLFAIAVIGIGAAYFASRIDGLRAAAFQQQAEAEAHREMLAISQTLLQAASVNALTEVGLLVSAAPKEPLMLDGRWYRVSEKGQISVQDERGLVSLNINDDNQLRRLLSAMGLPVKRHDRLIDTLRDYVDIDDLKRLNGAERRDYLEANLPPPANDFFSSRDELRRIPGWRELIDEVALKGSPGAADRFLGYFSVHRPPATNINTAPRLVVKSMAGVDQARVSALLDQRRIAPFRSADDLAPYLNGIIDFEVTQTVGTNTWRFTYQRDDLAFLIECRIVITPSAADKAIQMNECRHRPKNGMISDGDAEEFAGIFGSPVLPFSTEKKSIFSQTNSRQTSLFPLSRPFLNREASQREFDQPQLSWLKLQAGLGATPVESLKPASFPAPRQ